VANQVTMANNLKEAKEIKEEITSSSKISEPCILSDMVLVSITDPSI